LCGLVLAEGVRDRESWPAPGGLDSILEADGTFEGGLILQEFEAATDIGLPDTGGYETVGGFLMAQLGRIPRAGDTVAVDGGELEVVEVDERRVQTVRFTPKEPVAEEREEPEES